MPYCPLCHLSRALEKEFPTHPLPGEKERKNEAESNPEVLTTFEELVLCQTPSLKDATSFHFQGKLCASLVPWMTEPAIRELTRTTRLRRAKLDLTPKASMLPF